MIVNNTGVGTFPHAIAFAPYLRVKMAAGVLALAGAVDREIGTTKQRMLIAGVGQTTKGPVVLRTAAGTVKMIALDAIALYAPVYGAANGKVQAGANANIIGFNLGTENGEASTADGDEIEVLRCEVAGLAT